MRSVRLQSLIVVMTLWLLFMLLLAAIIHYDSAVSETGVDDPALEKRPSVLAATAWRLVELQAMDNVPVA
jgi:hypothetical protein